MGRKGKREIAKAGKSVEMEDGWEGAMKCVQEVKRAGAQQVISRKAPRLDVEAITSECV